MNEEKFKNELVQRIAKAFEYLKDEEVKANDTLSIAYKMQSLADLVSDYIKERINKKEFVKEVDTLINSIVSTFANQTFKAGAIFNFQSYLIGINSLVKYYVNQN